MDPSLSTGRGTTYLSYLNLLCSNPYPFVCIDVFRVIRVILELVRFGYIRAAGTKDIGEIPAEILGPSGRRRIVYKSGFRAG